MRYPEWLKNPERWPTMTKALAGVGLVATIHGTVSAFEWLIR